MSKSTASTLRKKSGGLKGKRRDKRKHESIEVPTPLRIGTKRLKEKRVMGGAVKIMPIELSEGNMFDPVSKKFTKVKLLKVTENPANRSYARRNIITKGSVIETSEGSARVINRPGQSGQVTLIKINKA